MKKIYFSMMAIAIAAFTFTACEDVPEPYNNPYDQIKPSEPEVVIEPTGSGTVDEPYNVAATLEQCKSLGADEYYNNGEDVYVTGIITQIDDINTTNYGNAIYYISDDSKGSNRLEVYHGFGLNGEKFTTGDEIEVGDTVTVCGKIKNYKGNTLEFDQGNKIVVLKKGEGGEKPASPGTAEAPLTVSEALAYIDNLGSDVQSPVGYVKGKICAIGEVDTGQYGNATYSISDDGKNENALQIYRGYSLGGEKFKSANEIKVGDEVIVTGKLINFKGNTKQFAQGSSIYSLNGTTAGGGGGGEAKGDGTLASPFNPIAAINFTSQLASGAKSANDVYIKGKISKIANNGTFAGGGTYGNASFYISEDGTESNEFYVFRTLYLGNVKYTSGTDIKIGDEVIICGKVMNYMGNTPETSANESYIYSLNGQTAGGGTPTTPTETVGTKDAPKTVADALTAINALEDNGKTEKFWYVKGKIKQIKTTADNIAKYKNIDYIITDDGNNELTVFRGKNLNNTDFTKEGEINIDDEVVVYGQLQKYVYNGNTTPEMAQGNYLVALNGTSNTPGGGGGEPSGSGGVLEGNKLTVVYGDLGITSVDSPIKLVDGTVLTFSQEDGKNKPVYHESTKIVRMYAHNSLTINAGSKVIDSVVLNYDTYSGTAYCGNEELYGEAGGKKLNLVKDETTITFSGVGASAFKVVNDLSTGNSGGVQLRCTGIIINFK